MQIPGSTRRAPRIHGELLKLGFDISERTVSRWVKRAMQKQSEAYTDAELKFLIRYGTESYRSMLEATTQLSGAVKAAPSREKPDRPAKSRRMP